MSTTYKFTVSRPTPCPFSGLHHADGHLLVLDQNQLAFFAPNDDGTPGRQLTDPRPLKSDADREHVKDWLDKSVADGVLVDTSAKPAPKADAPRPSEPAKQAAPQQAPASNQAPPPPTK